MLAEKQGQPQTALKYYEEALAIDPVDHLAVEQKIAILRQLGRTQEAQSFLEASFARARSVSDMNQLAITALRQGWAGSAEKLLRQVLESDPGNPGVLANLAASMARQGKMDEASKVMRQAVERDPTNASNYFNLGAMLASLGRPREALEAFEEAADKGLASPRVHVAAAKMHFRLGDPAAAEQELRRALQIAPNDPEATELLRVLQQGAGG
jgi:tetratricopeptide (TPR) repeat protein